MRKTKHYFGRHRTARGVRWSWPKWMRITITVTETYSKEDKEFLQDMLEWAEICVQDGDHYVKSVGATAS